MPSRVPIIAEIATEQRDRNKSPRFSDIQAALFVTGVIAGTIVGIVTGDAARWMMIGASLGALLVVAISISRRQS